MTTLAAIREFLATTFPQSKGTVEQVGHSSATVRQSVGFNELRPRWTRGLFVPGRHLAHPDLGGIAEDEVTEHILCLGKRGAHAGRQLRRGL